jgi:hypothetical protein
MNKNIYYLYYTNACMYYIRLNLKLINVLNVQDFVELKGKNEY